MIDLNDYDVVIVGAGPAGIACALALTEKRPGINVALVEAGRPYRRRPCPVDKGHACTGCSGTCNVISGFGGCMHYGDGVKLSLLPSGRRLIDLFGDATAERLCAEAFDLICDLAGFRPTLAGVDLAESTTDLFRADGLTIREYPVAVLAESELRDLLATAHGRVAAATDLLEWTEVQAVAPTEDGYRIDLASGASLSSDAVVVAAGRRGVASTAKFLHAVGAELESPTISLGIRFEMRADLLHRIGVEHPDLKISHRGGEHKTKTFCFCGGPNGGRIKFTNYQDAFGRQLITLDGHETTERVQGDRALAANFGLLCQLKRGDATGSRDSVLDQYQKLSDGRPMVQTLDGFIRRQADDRTWPEVAGSLSFEPSVRDLVLGRVDEMFTPSEHEDLVRGFQRTFEAILRHQDAGVTEADLRRDILVIGPEMEFLWDRVLVDDSCRVPGSQVYAIGDSAGWAQGIVQSVMMGLRAAEDLASQDSPSEVLSGAPS